MVYDNMRVAVVFDDKTKKPTSALQRLATYYWFRWRFCNASAGWEKGNVERCVDYIRGRAFTTCVDFDTIESAQEWLTKICKQMNQEETSPSTKEKSKKVFADLAGLKAYPGEIGCFELAEYKADKQSTICVKNNHYSVPENLAGENVLVKLYSEKIIVLDKNHKIVASHIRSYGTNEWIVDINHYMTISH